MNWLERLTVPLFVSRRRLCDRKRLPRAVTDWALDSGGFSELSQFGEWRIGTREYVAEVRRYASEIGRLQWASPCDWMCEPWICERTGMSVQEHQERTLASYRALLQAAPEQRWAPVLQGWRGEDYLRHWEAYEAAGIDLAAAPVVGLGSVCRRQHMRAAEQIVRSLSPLRLHAYGFKAAGLCRVADALVSADSLAWSAGARRRAPLPGCPHRRCANCARWALRWRARLLERVAQTAGPRQMGLGL